MTAQPRRFSPAQELAIIADHRQLTLWQVETKWRTSAQAILDILERHGLQPRLKARRAAAAEIPDFKGAR